MDSLTNPVDSSADQIEVKQKFEGKVLKTTLQGALVDIGSKLPAFIHISQVVKDNDPRITINSIEEVLKEGEAVQVWVKRVKKDRIELTMIEPLAYEWRELKPDMVLTGKVIRLETFGVFVEIGAERPGLVHISELAHNYIRTPSEVVREGDEVDVKILEVDRRKKQIKLSVKATQEIPEEPVFEKPKKSGKKQKAKKEEVVDEEVIPDPTFMEIALRQAMDRAQQKAPQVESRIRRIKEINTEQDEIIERTLKSKVDQD